MVRERRRPRPAGTSGGRQNSVNTASSLDESRRLFKPHEAAAYLGISARKVWQLGACGELPVVRLGRCTRYDRADLDAYIETRKGVRP